MGYSYYNIREGVYNHRSIIWQALALGAAIIFTAALSISIAASAGPRNSGGLGKVTVGTEVSSWNVGSGQFNGEFVVAEVQGIELGLRVQDRFEGPLAVTGDKGNRVGVYEASVGQTGNSDDNLGTWNYDWHVDLSNAKGNAAGKTLADYELALEQDFSNENIFGLGSNPVVLPFGASPADGTCFAGTFTSTLCQQSWNPGFGNVDYDPTVEGTYSLRLVLTPKTFNGPPLAVAVQVNVSE